ncbi:MAG: ABC transporter substrate-binding protein [Candidatus Limiplasma sp.]|nr:ABC transporter substrate-binding protein [Candidatus Limiplasma sp.]MEA5144727.1 ABC transporter substrate-binding protein [Candidatus Limiplasma sp.]
MKRKFSLLTALVMVLTALLVPVMATAEGEPVKIGVIAPLSGNLATYGESTTNGIKLAIEEINAAGGVLGGRPLEVIAYEDDKGDSTEGANAFNKLVSEGAKAIVGSVTSGVTAGLATLADAEGMLLLTPTATADSVTDGVKGVFRACFRDSFQGDVGAKVAVNLGVKKVAILYASGDTYSAGLYEAFKAAAATLGLEIVATESSSSTADTDYTTQLTNIVASGAELIFAPYYYDSIGPYIVPQARAAGYTGYFVGADGWDGTQNTMVEDKSLYNKCFFTNHYAPDDPSELVQGFVSKYTETFGAESLTALAALGYDAAYMLKAAIDAAGSDDTAAVIDALYGISFSGVTGTFTLDESGTPEKAAPVIEYVDGVAKFYAYI